MSKPIETSTLCYRLTSEEAGVKLEIWEPAQITEYRKAPYHFFIRYQLASEAEAQIILDQYLIDNEFEAAVCHHESQKVAPLRSTMARSKTYAA
ncbi:MAG: hypothetical protein AAF152_16040 [Cyanobacteria bacterium P01_A01_bin.114]